MSLLHSLVLHLPLLSTLVAFSFAFELIRRRREKGGGPHLLWWGIGMVTYGLGTLTESVTTLFGWHPFVFRTWYVVGAFLGGYPLAQGSIYLLMSRRFADWSARIVSTVIVLAAVLVFLTPLDTSLAEPHRLSGRVIVWKELRLISPFLNLYAVGFLAGGAVLSALRFRSAPELRSRFHGNVLIAVGAILPAVGGTFTRFGWVEVLYVTELMGLLLIFAGYRACLASPQPPLRSPRRLQTSHVLGGAASGGEQHGRQHESEDGHDGEGGVESLAAEGLEVGAAGSSRGARAHVVGEEAREEGPE